jgi:type IX secretion system PorP/SprF family membrane protein
MRNKACIYCLLLLFVSAVSIRTLLAQDPHFSQYFSSPLSFNPAFTGYFDGNHRLAINYRNQWSGVGDSYTTGTVSFDTRILQNRIGSNDRWGLGVHALYDKTAGGIYQSNYLSLSTGFHKGLDAEGDQSIGIGLQATVARSSIDFSRIYFNSQFNGDNFDLSIPSGETMNNRSVSYADLNAGVLYNYKDESGNRFAFGAAIYHVLKPRLNYFNTTTNTLASRYTVHASVTIPVNDNDQLFFSTNMMQQGGASVYVAGTAYGFGLGASETELYLGAWLRAKDALYPYAGLRTAAYQLGLSYDITSSDIQRQQKTAGSLELSFQYFFAEGIRKKGIPCFF